SLVNRKRRGIVRAEPVAGLRGLTASWTDSRPRALTHHRVIAKQHLVVLWTRYPFIQRPGPLHGERMRGSHIGDKAVEPIRHLIIEPFLVSASLLEKLFSV